VNAMQEQAPREEGTLGYCRNCGRPVPPGEGRTWRESLHCMECIVELSQQPPAFAPPASTAAAPGLTDAQAAFSGTPPGTPSVSSAPSSPAFRPPPPAPGGGLPSPFLALVLGLIPGVGAVYNGQYAKGVLHVVVFGGLISVISSGAADGSEPLFALLIGLMVFYMPIEAFRTARAMERGEAVDELSGLLSSGQSIHRSPALGVVLIILGVVFLLHSLRFWRIADLLPYWPVSLIAVGIYLLYRRVADAPSPGDQER
jgi:hypothetical protein